MNLIAPAPGTRLAALGHDYTVKPLLSEVEIKLYHILRAVSAERVLIQCKPRLADFFQHWDGLAAFNRISQKHVDFLICRPDDFMPMLAIELDDSTHNRADRRDRDSFVNNLFAHTGVPLLRIPVWELERLDEMVSRLTAGWDVRCLYLDAARP